MLMPALIRVRSLLDRYRPPGGGQTSTVATPFLRMTLDHDTGSMTGTILQGRFSGMRVEELGSADLLALLRECRAEDEEGARLLEAYLDRVHPDWRDELAGERAAGGSGGGARPTSGDMTVEEAYAILGLVARRRRRGDQGGASPADGQTAPRPRRLGLSGDQDQPRPRRAAAPSIRATPSARCNRSSQSAGRRPHR